MSKSVVSIRLGFNKLADAGLAHSWSPPDCEADSFRAKMEELRMELEAYRACD